MLHTWLLLSTLMSPPADASVETQSEAPRPHPPIEVEVQPEIEPEPPPKPKQIPRLFETLQGFRPSEVASHSNHKVTVTFIPGLQVRNEFGGPLTPFTLDRFGNQYHEGPYSAGRVRVNPTLRLGKKQNVDIVAMVDFFNGRWAPQNARSPVVGEILNPNPNTVAQGIPPVPTDVAYVDFRELYVQWNSKIGQLRAGQMAFTWGEGILASSGNWADRFGDMRFGSDGIGKIYERVMFATRPFSKLGGIAQNFIVAVGGDLVFRDDRVDLVKSCKRAAPVNGQQRCDLAGQVFVVLRYQPINNPGNWIGGYAVFRHQKNGDDGDVYLNDDELMVGVGDLAGQGMVELRDDLQLLGGFEAVMIGGRTNQVYNENGPHRILQGGAVMRAYAGNHERWLAGLDAGYASGDSNPSDKVLSGFSFDTSATVGLVLFQQVRGWRSAQSEILATNGDLTNVPLNGSQFIPNRGAVTNAMYIHPKARYAFAERFEVWGGPLIAASAAPEADPYTTRLNGGDPTNSVGGPGSRRYYGTELDIGLRGRFEVRKLWFQLGLQGGLLLPGKGLANMVGNTDGPTAAVWLRSEIRY